MIETRKITDLLQGTKNIIKHQREIEKLKGESFNVFSILKMESKENETHSAFLAELLDPKGSHLKGDTFLRLFLEIIGDTSIDPSQAKVKVEHYCGERNDKAKTGGRIDIFIWNEGGNSISIENKIYAGDQYAQIERYRNYRLSRKSTNTVYYLTLFGDQPSKDSKGKLQDGKGFHCLSYQTDIQEWLKRSMKEAAEEPILRESIKQYLILVKNLTSTMDKEKETELHKLMLKYYEEASFIEANFEKAKNVIYQQVRQKVIIALQSELKKLNFPYNVVEGNAIEEKHAEVFIKPVNHPSTTLRFGVESFSGNGHKKGQIFVGIKNQGGGKNLFTELNKSRTKYANYWINPQVIRNENDSPINLRNNKLIYRLSSVDGFMDEFAAQIVKEVVRYMKDESTALLEYLNKN
ncbi:PD-(D/E)XK nuclease family protein [uncultured Draconibacterium sp.]|uniref:PDDEXK-like family protein n=1 Tax=uncultured Draconibacterium sp. TaxID=1573823 RepID=UPI0025F453DC|nr:PD-(D/E)XK nuclease family protein [uncultured Draconibacterium sp.]